MDDHPAAMPRKLMKEIIVPPIVENKPKYVGRRTGRVFDDRFANGNEWLLKDETTIIKDTKKIDLYASDSESSSSSDDESFQRKLNDWGSLTGSEAEEVDDLESEEEEEKSKSVITKLKTVKSKVSEMKEKLMKPLQNESNSDDDEVEVKIEDPDSPDFKRLIKIQETTSIKSQQKPQNIPTANRNSNNINITNNFLKSTNKSAKDYVKREEEENKVEEEINSFNSNFEHNAKFTSKDEEFSFLSNKNSNNIPQTNNKNFPSTNISSIKKKTDKNYTNIMTDTEYIEDESDKNNINKKVSNKKSDFKDKIKSGEIVESKNENNYIKNINKNSVKVIKQKTKNKENKEKLELSDKMKNENNKKNLISPKLNSKSEDKDEEMYLPLNEIKIDNKINQSIPKRDKIKEKSIVDNIKNPGKRTFAKAFPDRIKEDPRIKRGPGGKKIVVSENQFIKNNYQRMLDSSSQYQQINEDEAKQYFGVSNRYSRRIRIPRLNKLAGERISYSMEKDPLLKINVPKLLGVFTSDTQLSKDFYNSVQISKPKSKRKLTKGLRKIDKIEEEIEDDNEEINEEDLPEEYEEEKDDNNEDYEILRIFPMSQKGNCRNLNVVLYGEILDSFGRNKLIIGKETFENVKKDHKFKIPPNNEFNFINLSKDKFLRVKLIVD